MHKKYLLIILVATVVVGSIGLILLWKTASSQLNILRIPIRSTTTSGSNLTPLGTPYTQPQEEKRTATTTQSGRIDEYLTIDNTLRDVNFCGTRQIARQIFINGVDVVQRIAELATEIKIINLDSKYSLSKEICTAFSNTRLSKEDLGDLVTGQPTGMSIPEVTNWTNTDGHKMYSILLPSWFFSIDSTTNDIYLINGYDGSLMGPIGVLK